jgi:hypothetical protein
MVCSPVYSPWAFTLTITKLEVVTLAYTIMNIGIYIAWWDKPRSVNHPVRVFLSDIAPHQKQDEEIDLADRWLAVGNLLVPGGDYIYDAGGVDTTMWKSVPTFYSGDLTALEFNLAGGAASLIGLVFGGVHCIAWSFYFSSHTEQLLWRMSVAAMVIIPALIAVTIGVDMLYGKYKKPSHRLTKKMRLFAVVVVVNVLALAGLLYTICRAITLTLAFKNLGSLPSTAYHTIPWTQWIPHI